MSKIWLSLLLGTTLTTVSLAQPIPVEGPSAERTAREQRLRVFVDILDRVANEHVDKPDEAALMEAAIKGMMGHLDPYSSHLERQNYASLQEGMRGQFGGVGIEVSLRDKTLMVMAAIEESPAFKAGITTGDIITHINEEAISDWTLQKMIDSMRGAPGTRVRLQIKTGETIKDITLTRAVIQTRTVAARAEGDIAYVRLYTFNQRAAHDVEEALKKTLAQIGPTAKGVVLDLRNNSGGLLDQAGKVADLFLDDGVITTTRDRNDAERSRLVAQNGDIAQHLPMVVLINGGSASASEVVAGALQDHKRAVLIGTQSFGKGSVQTIRPLRDGSGLRLTVARYYTPHGRMIHEEGIAPNHVVEMPSTDPSSRRRGGPIPQQLAQDPQLQKAIDVLHTP